MKVKIYHYNDLKAYASGAFAKPPKSNLCTWYYDDRKRFCGNYCSRKNGRFNRRCWIHSKNRASSSASLPSLVLLMISSSERTYNRELWIEFLRQCEKQWIPIEFIIYHEDMRNCTVREAHNLVSRFRPFPDIFGNPLPLRGKHGGVNFAQICLKMLEYGCKIPNAARCILLTERTVPIRSPLKMYKRALSSKCHIDISYNVGFDRVPQGIPSSIRGKPYQGVNNLCQGLYTVDFLKLSLPTIRRQCKHFGISFDDRKSMYTVTDERVFEQWRRFTGANPSEFWLLNSYILDTRHERPMLDLKRFMETCSEADKYTVAEIPEYREGVKRTFVFRDREKRIVIPIRDARTKAYYRGLNFSTGITLREIVRFVKINKRRALFFRQVELP